MSKPVKKTLVFIGLTAAAFLIICVFAMLLGGCVTPQPAASPSPTASASPSAEVSPSEPVQEESPEPSESAAPDDGVQCDLDGDGKPDYSITTPADRDYVYVRMENGAERYEDMEIMLSSAKDASLYIELSLTPNTTAAKLSPGFADSYIDASDTEYAGVSNVGASSLRGEQIRAQSEEANLSAWLVDTDKGVLSIVLVYTPDVGDAIFEAAFEAINSITLK